MDGSTDSSAYGLRMTKGGGQNDREVTRCSALFTSLRPAEPDSSPVKGERYRRARRVVAPHSGGKPPSAPGGAPPAAGDCQRAAKGPSSNAGPLGEHDGTGPQNSASIYRRSRAAGAAWAGTEPMGQAISRGSGVSPRKSCW